MAAVTGNVAPPSKNSTFQERTILRSASPKLKHDSFIKFKKIPLNNTDTITQRRYYNFDEEVGTGKTYISDEKDFLLRDEAEAGGKKNVLTYEDYEGSVVQVGGEFNYTWRGENFNYESVRKEGLMKLGEQAGLVADAYWRNKLIENTALDTENYAYDMSSETDMDVAGKAILDMFRRMVAVFEDRDMEPVVKMMGATERFASVPVPEGFYALTTPWLIYSLESLSDSYYVPARKYTKDPARGEKGSVAGVRLITTSHAFRAAWATDFANENVYSRSGTVCNVLVFAKDTFAGVTLRGPGRVRILDYGFGEVPGEKDKHKNIASIVWDSWLGYIEQDPLGRGRIAINVAS